MDRVRTSATPEGVGGSSDGCGAVTGGRRDGAWLEPSIRSWRTGIAAVRSAARPCVRRCKRPRSRKRSTGSGRRERRATECSDCHEPAESGERRNMHHGSSPARRPATFDAPISRRFTRPSAPGTSAAACGSVAASSSRRSRSHDFAGSAGSRSPPRGAPRPVTTIRSESRTSGRARTAGGRPSHSSLATTRSGITPRPSRGAPGLLPPRQSAHDVRRWNCE